MYVDDSPVGSKMEIGGNFAGLGDLEKGKRLGRHPMQRMQIVQSRAQSLDGLWG